MRGEFGRYLVTGRRAYRGHKPGMRFEARLDRNAEQRAIARGDIVLEEVVVPRLKEGSYRLPDDWPPGEADTPANPRRREALLS